MGIPPWTRARTVADFFVHETWHEGSELTSGVKYVLRSDVLYGSGRP